ncbi:MAG TPA: SIS domain-containing protein [Nitrososphaeraceae archaeon]
MISYYEANVLNQLQEWKRIIIQSHLPSAIYTTNSQQRRLIFVGIGSSYWAARISEFLWREHVSPDCISLHSYDLVKSRFLISTNDIFVLFSHRGTKTFSLQALEIAKKSGATTILVTGIGSPGNSSADIRIETCAQENCGAFTISLTSAIARIIQWIGLQSNKEIIVRFNETIDKIQLPFNIVRLPSYTTNFVIVGDLIREAVAHEVSLKISETCYLPVRSFGLEQFLHGPKVTIDKQSSILAFTSKTELRKESLLKYAEAIGSEVIEINEDTSGFDDIPQDFVWLAQLLYGQYMALELSRRLGTNPDTVRADQSPYNEARDLVTL